MQTTFVLATLLAGGAAYKLPAPAQQRMSRRAAAFGSAAAAVGLAAAPAFALKPCPPGAKSEKPYTHRCLSLLKLPD